MKHIVSWSGGKDSTATIILAHEHGLPIDLIVISLMWFDKKKKIYAEYPEHTKWIFEYAIPLFESWGYPVKVITSEKDYKYWFYHVVTKSTNHPERNGKYSGFVLGGMCRMNGEKTIPIKKYLDSLEYEYEEYVGIAIDEPDRLRRLNGKAGKSSLLERYGYTEIMARAKCEEYGLLSPSYKIFKRGGCWFCPNQSIPGFAYLKQTYPEYWEELRTLSLEENTVSQYFKYGRTFAEVEKDVDEYIISLQFAAAQLSLFDLIEEGV